MAVWIPPDNPHYCKTGEGLPGVDEAKSFKMLPAQTLVSKIGLFPYGFDDLLFMRKRLYKRNDSALWVPSEETTPYFWRPSGYFLNGTTGYKKAWSRDPAQPEPMGASNWAILELSSTELAKAVQLSGVDEVDFSKLAVFNVGNTEVADGVTGMIGSRDGSTLMPKLIAMYDAYPDLFIYECNDLQTWVELTTFTSEDGWSLYGDPLSPSVNNTRQDEDDDAEKKWGPDVSFFEAPMLYAGEGRFMIPRSYRAPMAGQPDRRPAADSKIVLSAFPLESGQVKDDLFYGVLPMTLWETREVDMGLSATPSSVFFYSSPRDVTLGRCNLRISDVVYLGRRVWKDFLRPFMHWGMWGFVDPVLDFTVHPRTWGYDGYASLRNRGYISDHITADWGRAMVGRRYLRAVYWDPQCPESGRVCSGGNNNYWEQYVVHVAGDFDEVRKYQDGSFIGPGLLPIWGYECDRMTSAYKIWGEVLCQHDQGIYEVVCERFHNYWVNGGPNGFEPLCVHRRGFASWYGPQPWVNFGDTWDDMTNNHSTGSCPSPSMLNQSEPYPRPTFSEFPAGLEFWQVWNFTNAFYGFSYHLYPNSDYGNQHFKSMEWYRGDSNGTNGAYSVYAYPPGCATTFDGLTDEDTGESLLKLATQKFFSEFKGSDIWNYPPGVLTAKDVEEYGDADYSGGSMVMQTDSGGNKQVRYWSVNAEGIPENWFFADWTGPIPIATCYFSVGAVYYLHCKAKLENGVVVPETNGILFVERSRQQFGQNIYQQDWIATSGKSFKNPAGSPGPYDAAHGGFGQPYGNGGQIDVLAVMGDGQLLVEYARESKEDGIYKGYGLWDIATNTLTMLGPMEPGGNVGTRASKITIDNYYRWGSVKEGDTDVDVYMPTGINTALPLAESLKLIKGDGRSYTALGTASLGDLMPMRPGYRGLPDLKTQVYSESPRPKVFLTRPGELATVAIRDVAGYADGADSVNSMLVSTSTITAGGSYGRHTEDCAAYLGGVYCRVLLAPPLRSVDSLAFDFPCSIVKVLSVEYYDRPIRPEQASLQTPEQAALPEGPNLLWELWVANQEHWYIENNVIGLQQRTLPSLNGYVLVEFISTPKVLQVHHLWYWGLYGSQVGYFYPTWDVISKGNGEFYEPKIESLVVPRFFLGTGSQGRYPDETPKELKMPVAPAQTYGGGTALAWTTPASNPAAKDYGTIQWKVPRNSNLDCGL